MHSLSQLQWKYVPCSVGGHMKHHRCCSHPGPVLWFILPTIYSKSSKDAQHKDKCVCCLKLPWPSEEKPFQELLHWYTMQAVSNTHYISVKNNPASPNQRKASLAPFKNAIHKKQSSYIFHCLSEWTRRSTCGRKQNDCRQTFDLKETSDFMVWISQQKVL